MCAKSCRRGQGPGGHAYVPSRQVLSELPLRVIVFLRTIARSDAIRAALLTGGYGPEAHQEGCRLLQAVCAYPTTLVDPAADERARAALSALDEYARRHFPRFRAMCERYFPAFADRFAVLADRDPADALKATRALLDWLASAESAAQKQVVEKLAERGLTLAERQRLAQLAEVASAAEAPGTTAVGIVGAGPRQSDARDQAVLALYDWYSDWSATARAVIARKDFRHSLGIGERRLGARSVD